MIRVKFLEKLPELVGWVLVTMLVASFVGPLLYGVVYYYESLGAREWHRGEWATSANNMDLRPNDPCYFNAVCNCGIDRCTEAEPPKLHFRPNKPIRLQGNTEQRGPTLTCRSREPNIRCEYCVDEIDCTDQNLDPSIRRKKCCIP
jgi:hypothetical protein